MIPLWPLFLISHSTSWLIRSPRPVNIKIRKLLVHYFATALTSFIRKCRFKVRGHAFTWKQPVSSLARLSSAYWLFHTRGGAAVWSTPKRVVCMVFFQLRERGYSSRGTCDGFFHKRGSAILYHPPAVHSTWVESRWGNSGGECIYTALEGNAGGEENRWERRWLKAGDKSQGVKKRREENRREEENAIMSAADLNINPAWYLNKSMMFGYFWPCLNITLKSPVRIVLNQTVAVLDQF